MLKREELNKKKTSNKHLKSSDSLLAFMSYVVRPHIKLGNKLKISCQIVQVKKQARPNLEYNRFFKCIVNGLLPRNENSQKICVYTKSL